MITYKHKQKKVHRVKNWSDYNEALVQRGSLEIWLSAESRSAWYANPSGRPGAPEVYSAEAITCALCIRKLFRLPLRQTEGFVRSVFRQSTTILRAPDYTTLSRRGGHLLVKLPKKRKKKTIIIMDSSGVKVYGEGEWKMRQHGKSKRRKWKKIHVAIDETGEVRATDISDEDTTDGEAALPLLRQEHARITAFLGDGGYDKRKVYQALQRRAVAQVAVPPQRNAKIWQHGNAKDEPHPRDINLRAIRQGGKKRWKQETGYSRRVLVENTIFRFKTIFGDRVLSRENSRQVTELTLAFAMLNRMFELGRPDSYAAAL